MATPIGLKPVPSNSRTRQYVVAPGDNRTYAVGDLVALIGGSYSGPVMGGGTVSAIPLVGRWSSGPVLGAITEVHPRDRGLYISEAATVRDQHISISVCDDPSAEFEIVCNNPGALAPSVVGGTFNILPNDQPGAQSGAVLDVAAPGHQARVTGAVSTTAGAVVRVALQGHALTAGGGVDAPVPTLTPEQYAAPASMPAGVLYLAPGGAVVVRRPSVSARWSAVSEDGASPVVPGCSVAIIGDSIAYANTSDIALTPNSITTWSAGFAAWTLALMGVRPGALTNLGIGGERSSHIAGRIGSVVALQPDVCFINGGTNDIDSATMVSEWIANMGEAYRQLQDAGIFTLAFSPTPKNSDSAQKKDRYRAIEQWMLEYWGSRKDGIAVPARTAVIDPATGNWYAASTYDGVHPSNTGGYLMGKAAIAAIGSRLIYREAGLIVGDDDARTSNANSLLLNPNLAGTAGSNGAGCSGQVATSWTALCTGACTAAHAKAVDGHFGVQEVTITASGGGAEYLFYQETPSLSPGVSVRGAARVEVVSPTNVETVRLRMFLPTGRTIGALAADGNATGVYTENFSVVMHTPPGVVTTGAGTAQLEVRCRFKAAGSVTLRISRPTMMLGGV